jgi:hypothetical protein
LAFQAALPLRERITVQAQQWHGLFHDFGLITVSNNDGGVETMQRLIT